MTVVWKKEWTNTRKPIEIEGHGYVDVLSVKVINERVMVYYETQEDKDDNIDRSVVLQAFGTGDFFDVSDTDSYVDTLVLKAGATVIHVYLMLDDSEEDYEDSCWESDDEGISGFDVERPPVDISELKNWLNYLSDNSSKEDEQEDEQEDSEKTSVDFSKHLEQLKEKTETTLNNVKNSNSVGQAKETLSDFLNKVIDKLEK